MDSLLVGGSTHHTPAFMPRFLTLQLWAYQQFVLNGSKRRVKNLQSERYERERREERPEVKGGKFTLGPRPELLLPF